jgi:hypothetical protein
VAFEGLPRQIRPMIGLMDPMMSHWQYIADSRSELLTAAVHSGRRHWTGLHYWRMCHLQSLTLREFGLVACSAGWRLMERPTNGLDLRTGKSTASSLAEIGSELAGSNSVLVPSISHGEVRHLRLRFLSTDVIRNTIKRSISYPNDIAHSNNKDQSCLSS